VIRIVSTASKSEHKRLFAILWIGQWLCCSPLSGAGYQDACASRHRPDPREVWSSAGQLPCPSQGQRLDPAPAYSESARAVLPCYRTIAGRDYCLCLGLPCLMPHLFRPDKHGSVTPLPATIGLIRCPDPHRGSPNSQATSSSLHNHSNLLSSSYRCKNSILCSTVECHHMHENKSESVQQVYHLSARQEPV